MNKGGKLVKSYKEADNWMQKFSWSVWLFSQNDKYHEVYDEAVINLSGPQYIKAREPAIAAMYDVKMDSIILFKKYDDLRVEYTGDMTNDEEIRQFILGNYLPLIKSPQQANLSGEMYNNSTVYVLFSEPDDPAVAEINKIGRELNDMFDCVANVDLEAMEANDRYIVNFGAMYMKDRLPFLGITKALYFERWDPYIY